MWARKVPVSTTVTLGDPCPNAWQLKLFVEVDIALF